MRKSDESPIVTTEMAPASSLNAFFLHDSAPRLVMFTGQLSQMLTITGATRKRIRSGVEKNWAEATFKQDFKHDAIVRAVIPKYRCDGVHDNFKENPETAVVYEHHDTGILDIMILTTNHCRHQHYGFKYKYNESVVDALLTTPNARFSKGTIVADSPNVTDDGDYTFGVEANVCSISDAAVTEDAMVYSKSFADKIRVLAVESRVFSVGKMLPINAYGTTSNYKCVPDVGELIGSNGLLAALRPYGTYQDAVYLTSKRLMSPVYGLDDPRYGYPNAKITDIKILRGDDNKDRKLPLEMTAQLDRYHEATLRYYKDIIRTALVIKPNRKPYVKPNLSNRFTAFLYNAFAYCGQHLLEDNLWPYDASTFKKLSRRFRGELLDDYRVEVTFEYLAKVCEGSKSSGLHGNKGIAGQIRPDEDMPIDENGIRADIMRLHTSSNNRMNPGVEFEVTIGAAGRDMIRKLRSILGLGELTVYDREEIFDHIEKVDMELLKEAEAWLLGFYKIVTPNTQYKWMYEHLGTSRSFRHIAEVVLDGNDPKGAFIDARPNITPTDTKVNFDPPRIIEELANSPYRPNFTKVTYRDHCGVMRTTKLPVPIGPSYQVILEKTATDGSAVSSSHMNHFGTTVRPTEKDKYSTPSRETTTKTLDEATVRNMAQSMGGDILAHILEMNNNPVVHSEVCDAILTAEKPTNIDEVVDRKLFPVEGHRPANFVEHHLHCSGKGIRRPLRSEEV